jgi:hypothetical protein
MDKSYVDNQFERKPGKRMSAPNANPNPNSGGASMATELGQFDNPVSGTIIGAIVGMTLIGFILLLFGSGYGILFTVAEV